MPGIPPIELVKSLFKTRPPHEEAEASASAEAEAVLSLLLAVLMTIVTILLLIAYLVTFFTTFTLSDPEQVKIIIGCGILGSACTWIVTIRSFQESKSKRSYRPAYPEHWGGICPSN